jgi:hypothetical protein
MNTLLVIALAAAIYLYVIKQIARLRLDYKRNLTHHELMYKLSAMINKSYYEVFFIAGEECGFSKAKIENDFKLWAASYGWDAFPNYINKFLEDGREVIEKAKVFTLFN